MRKPTGNPRGRPRNGELRNYSRAAELRAMKNGGVVTYLPHSGNPNAARPPIHQPLDPTPLDAYCATQINATMWVLKNHHLIVGLDLEQEQELNKMLTTLVNGCCGFQAEQLKSKRKATTRV